MYDSTCIQSDHTTLLKNKEYLYLEEKQEFERNNGYAEEDGKSVSVDLDTEFSAPSSTTFAEIPTI